MADFLTKALAPPKFHDFISKLSMINIYHDKLEGGYREYTCISDYICISD
jgi:hypothetical protein